MRGASIQIGAGVLLAGLIGFWNDTAAFGVLIGLGVLLLAHGVYDDFIKPRFRVEHRLKDWFMRRAWAVGLEYPSKFNFMLRMTSASSRYEVIVTRDKKAQDDILAFTSQVPLHPKWLDVLPKYDDLEREILLAEIRMHITLKNLSFAFVEYPTGGIIWPPTVIVQTGIAQDHTLTQQSVDITAKSVESTMIGVRDVIRKSVAAHVRASRAMPARMTTVKPNEGDEAESGV